VNSEVGFLEVILKLIYRVFIPVFVGQVIHIKVPLIKDLFKKHKKTVKAYQERCMSFIVYCVFCNTFRSGTEASLLDICLMAFIQLAILLTAMKVGWFYMFTLFPAREHRRLCIMGFYGCHHKTIAMGIPLLNAIFDGDSRLGMYTLVRENE
jgi:solute carrier family 10 (sodium/bile acid cotransporter), member 7